MFPRDYRFKSDSFVPSLFRHVPSSLASPATLSTLVLARRFIRIVAISEALFQKKCPHSPRRTEEGGGGGGGRMEAKAVSRVEKYFSRRLRARPLRTCPILPFVLFHPFGGPVLHRCACAFPDFISLGKIIVALARATSPASLCATAYPTRFRESVCASTDVYLYVCERRKNNGTELASNR